MIKLEPLVGHTSPETAYVVENYPYGFKLKCKIRYWLEHDPKKGYRFCSQTTNPKKSYEHWNAPKKSTYTMFGVMGLDENDHVTWTGFSMYDCSKAEEFAAEYADKLFPTQAKHLETIVAAYKAYAARKVTYTVTSTPAVRVV